MKERIGEVTVHLTLNKKPLKSGLHPIYVRIQHRSANRYYSCRCDMTTDQWKRFEKCPDEDHPAMAAYRRYKDAVRTLVREDSFSFTSLSRMACRSGGTTLQELARETAGEFRSAGKHNTADIYEYLAVSIDRFNAGKGIPVTQTTPDLCKRFLAWLSTSAGNGPTTVSIKARTLTAVLSRAVSGRLLHQNPMDGVRRPAARKKNMNISRESLSLLLNASQKEIGEGNLRWLRYWRAAYFGNGMNIRDLLLLQRKNIQDMEIVFTRHKTAESAGRYIHVPITPELHDNLGPIATGTEHLLPDLDGCIPGSREEHTRIRQTIKNINAHMKETCRLLRIGEHVTTNTARHTFATRLVQAGVPVEFISDALGHSRIKTTQNYLDGYTQEQRRRTADILKA